MLRAGGAETVVHLADHWPGRRSFHHRGRFAFYLPSNMQETLHHGFALIFAALFTRVLRDPPGKGRRWIVAALILTIVFAATLRPTWLLLLVALGCALVLRGGITLRQGGLLGAGLLVLAWGTAKSVVAISSPWPLWRPGLPTLPIDARSTRVSSPSSSSSYERESGLETRVGSASRSSRRTWSSRSASSRS